MNRRVFLSYSRTNFSEAEAIRHALAVAGHDVWLDNAELRAGQEWWDVITTEIRSRDVLVLLASADSIGSQFCRAEWKYAFALNRAVIPVIIEPLTPDELPDELRRKHGRHYSAAIQATSPLSRDVEDAEVEPFPNPIPSAPKLPSATSTKGSAFLDLRFRIDLEEIRRLIEHKEWGQAAERTRNALLGLAGLPALQRGYLKTSGFSEDKNEVETLPCDALEALAAIWSAAEPPIDENFGDLPGYRIVRKKIEYPTIWVARRAEIESPLFDQMRVFEERCRECGVEPFFFFARPDGELNYVPKHILESKFQALTSPAAINLLRFCAFFRSWYVDCAIEQLALAADLIDDSVAEVIRQHATPANGLRHILEDLWSRNLIRNVEFELEPAGFNSQPLISAYLTRQMSGAERAQWHLRLFRVLAHLTTKIPLGDHWLKSEVEVQLKTNNVTPPRKPSIEAMKRWLAGS